MLNDLMTPGNFKVLEAFANENNISNSEAASTILKDWCQEGQSKPTKRVLATTKPKPVDKQAPVVQKTEKPKAKIVTQLSSDTAQLIGDLPGLTTRAQNTLVKKFGCVTVADMLKLQEDDISNTKGVGPGTVKSILDAQARFGVSPVEVSVPTVQPAAVQENYSRGLLIQFDSLGVKGKDLKQAMSLFQSADPAFNMDLTRSLMKSSGFDGKDPDTYEDAILTLRENLPIQGEQIDSIRALGKELGESNTVIEESRPMATYKKVLSDLSVGEAVSLIEDMESDIRAFQSDELDSMTEDLDDLLDDEDTFFDDIE